MRHRIAGNRINMPEPKRRSAFRNLIDGLITHEHLTTTTARAKAIQGEAESLIATAIRGHNNAWAHLTAVVEDEYLAEQVLAVARKGSFRIDDELPALDELNAQRERAHKLPLSEEGRARKLRRIEAMQKEMLDLIRDRDEAQRALDAAREAMAIELHARRTILRHLPRELAVRKIFEQLVPKYNGRNGGYTRITKIGRRLGDAAEIARLELV